MSFLTSPRSRLLAAFALANLVLFTIAIVVWSNKPAAPPQIQGVLLPEPRPVQKFTLLDHNKQAFSNQHLLGNWHLVSYGFTTCPDVCPTTLSTLATVAGLLKENGQEVPRILFYSVDHRRDTTAQLKAYVPFFHPDFLGLTHLDDSENPHLGFEQSLGIFAQLIPLDEQLNGEFTNAYQVNHGVTLLLLNPSGQLQATFEPGEDRHGIKVFDAQQIYHDYLQISRYLDRKHG
jgi:protein SCO1